MKILLCSPINGIGGISMWTKHIINYHNKVKSGIDIHCCYPKERQKHHSFRILHGFVTYLPFIINLRINLNANHYDIAHLSTSASIGLIRDMIILKMCKARGIKTVLHFHFGRITALFKSNSWEKKLICKVINIADKVIVMDEMSYNTLLTFGYKHIALLPNPLSTNIETAINDNIGIVRKKTKIVFAGHVIATKGVYELVEAGYKLNLQNEVEIYIFGQIRNDMKARLIQLAGANNKKWLNIMGNHTFEEIIKEMLSASIFVLPTYTEGFPNVILESMACGCPIISTPVGAIPEMLALNSDTPCGICVEPKNVEQLKSAIELLLSDSDLAMRLGHNAQKRVREQYNMHSVWRQLVSIWEKVLIEKKLY